MSIGVDQAQSNGPVNVLIAGSAPGTPGTPGVGIADVRVDDQGQLLITKTDAELITLSLDAVVQLAAMQAAANIGTNINELEANVVAAASSAVTSQGAAAESDKSAVVAEQHAADAKTAADQAVPLLTSATNAVAGVTADAAAVKVMLTAALNGATPLVYRGYWDAAKNSPQLDSGVGNEGDLYLVAVAGTTSVDGAAEWNVGDGIWFTNGHWQYFARASWVAVAQSLYALRSVPVGSHELSADAALPFQIRDAAGNVALQVAQDGALHVLGLGLCDGSALDADTSQPSALRLVGSDGSYVDLDAPDYEQRIAQHAPALWLDAAVGVVTDDSGVVQSWSSRVASPWQVTVKTGTPVRFATAAGYAVRFDGTSALSHTLTTTPGTIIAVYRNTVSTASAQPVIMGSDSATAGTPAWSLRGYIPMGVPGAYARAQGFQVGTSASVSGFAGRLNAALGHWQILGATYDGDNIAAAVGLTHATPVARALTATPLVCGGSGGLIGASYAASGILTDFFVGDLAELLVWDRVLTGREYDDVVRALQSKHSLQPVFGRYLYSAFQTTQAGNEAGGIEGLVMLSSDDGVSWQHVPTEMLFDAEHTMRDASITYHGGRFVLACTASSFAAGYQDRFSVWQSTDGRHWDFVTDVQCALNGVSAHQTWAPEWYHDPADGQLRLVVHCIIGTGGSQVYEMHPLDDLLISWSVPQLITLAGYPQVIDSFPLCIKGQWVLFFKDEAARQIQIATATSPTGPYTVQTSGNWAGWGSGVEGPSALYLGDDADGNTMLRVYLDAQGNGISYSDAVGKWPDVLTGAWSPRSCCLLRHAPSMAPVSATLSPIMEPDMGLKISLANTSFARSLEFVPASDATITDWYVFGDRTGSGSVTDGLINQAAGAKAPTVTGAADIIVRANSIIVNNTKSAIISNLPGSGDFTAFAVVVPDFFNAATAATGQGNPVVAGMLGVIPFGNILGGTSLSGVVVQANAQSADTFNWQGFSQGVYSGFSTLHQIFNPSIPVPIGTAPILVALVQSVATKTVTFYDLTNAPSQALSAGPMGTGYNVATSNLVVGGSYDADIGNGPCLGAQLSFWCGSNRAMTQPEVQSMAANIRRFMLNRGVVVG